MKTIFEPVSLPNLRLKNRLIRSATWEGLANRDGSPPPEQVRLYEELAAGGVGGIIAGFTSVSAHDRYIDGMMRLSSDGLIPAYRTLTKAVKAFDCAFLTQIALSAYEKAGGPSHTRSLEIDRLTEEDIRDIVKLFAAAAARARAAGFDGVQIHAAHGFFLSRFISPAHNHRTDGYGGSAKNRAKILTDILDAIRAATGNFHISIKINCSDFMRGGLTEQGSLIVCQQVALHGIDSIEVSGSGTSRAQIVPGKNEAYFLGFAAALKKLVSVPVILVGGHRSTENISRILRDTSIECVSLSRPLIREPNLPKRWQDGDIQPAACISCNYCYETPGHQCVFNGHGTMDK